MHILMVTYQELCTDHSPGFGSGNRPFSVAEVTGVIAAGFCVSRHWVFGYSLRWEEVAFSPAFEGCDGPIHGLLLVKE